MPRRVISISARSTIAAPPAQISEVVGDLDRHPELTDRGLRILALDGPPGRRSGGVVELRGPMGVTRLARTRVRGAAPPTRLWGTAETAGGALARLEWRLRAYGDRTEVELRLDVQARRWSDRLLLHLGGRAWLGARLRASLERLGQILNPPQPRPLAWPS